MVAGRTLKAVPLYMHWIALVVVIVALLAASYRDLRYGFALFGALVLAAIVFYFASGADPWPGSATEIDPAKLASSPVTIERAYADSYRMTTRIENPSDAGHIRELAMKIRVLDCATESTEDADCQVVSQTASRVSTNIPPGQARDVVTVVSPPAFTITGVARWRVAIDDVRTR